MDKMVQVAALVAALVTAGPVPGDAIDQSPLPRLALTLPMQTLPMQRLPMQRLPMQTLPMQTLPMQTLPMQTLPTLALPTLALPTLALPTLTLPALRPPGEDKFRHAAAGWAITAFAYSAARAAGRDGDDALAIALPITAAFGVGKEIADQQRGSGFSVGDLIADAIGAGAAWLVLREVH